MFIPVIQKEMDIFQETVWNSHRNRKDAQLPKGVPKHVYNFPEHYGAEDCGMNIFRYFCFKCPALPGAKNHLFL